jgi:flagellin-like protein
MNGCYTIVKKFTLTQKGTVQNTVSGIKLAYTFNTSPTQKYSTIYDLVKGTTKNPITNYYNYSTKETKYILQSFTSENINPTSYHLSYSSDYNIYSITDDLSPKCSITIPYENCTFTATSDDLLDNYLMYKFNVCNELGGCYNLAKKFTLIQKDYAQKVVSGINISYQAITTLPTYPYYDSDITPYNNSNIISNQISIVVNEGSESVSWINITINNINYTMTDQGDGTWIYTINTTSNPTSYQFEAYYNTDSLGENTFTLLRDHTSTTMPALTPISLLISILIITSLFIPNKKQNKTKNKKAIAPVIATVLLLLVAVSAFTVMSSWYSSMSNDFQTKNLQGDNFDDNAIKLLDIKYEGSIPTLYIKSSYSKYIKIENLVLNSYVCTLNGGNAILANSITKVYLNCNGASINSVNDVKIVTKEKALIKKVKLSN